jgi:acyl dehydratase
MARLIDADVRLGTECPSVSKQFNVDMFKSGDVLTLHNDQKAAELEGLPRPIAVAPQVAALIFRMMRMSFGNGWIVGGKGSLTFRRPVWADDFATARGVVAGKMIEDNHVRVTCNVWVERADGEHAIVGICSALVDTVASAALPTST